LERCGGAKRGARLNPSDYPTFESLIQTWNKVEVYVREFLCKLQDEDLVRNVKYTIDGTKEASMPLGELMQHAANHGVHHRGSGCPPVKITWVYTGQFRHPFLSR
ncbi:MAG: DinB family protein, partial [Acidobacteria bacterium]|nr:DinB family protein [Acidobacteriota bacterium]